MSFYFIFRIRQLLLKQQEKGSVLDFIVIHIEIDRYVSKHLIHIRSSFEIMAYRGFFVLLAMINNSTESSSSMFLCER